MNSIQLLVIGAGPYALSTAALARERGIGSVVLGRPMGFWRENMPEGMFLRSGPDWHLDGAAVHTLEAYLEDQGIRPGEVDPVPIGVFLDYAAWFKRAKGIEVREEFVDTLVKANGRFEATLRSGERIRADAVVAAPGSAITPAVPAGRRRCRPGSRLIPATSCVLMTWPGRACWSSAGGKAPTSGPH